MRRRGSYPLLLGEIRDLLTDVFHYSILHLLSVATERVTNGHLVSKGYLIGQGCLTKFSAMLQMSDTVATRHTWLLSTKI